MAAQHSAIGIAAKRAGWWCVEAIVLAGAAWSGEAGFVEMRMELAELRARREAVLGRAPTDLVITREAARGLVALERFLDQHSST